MRIDESELPPGWDENLAVERDPDGAIRRVTAKAGSDSAVLEIHPDRMVVHDTREVPWLSDPADQMVVMGALQGVIARSRGIACSFCAKPMDAVRKLISGSNAYICDECIVVCADILMEEEDDP